MEKSQEPSDNFTRPKFSAFGQLFICLLVIVFSAYICQPKPSKPPEQSEQSEPFLNTPNTQEEDTTTDTPHTQYDENVIVDLVTNIYRLYLQLDYISPEEIVWPSQSSHIINQTLCEELHLDPAVISLMKRLPYFRAWQLSADVPFFPLSRTFVYLDDDEIRGGRDPDRFQYQEPDLGFLLPHEIALSCETDQGIHIILDTKESTIRAWAPWDWDADLLDNNYRLSHAYHAPTYLASHIQKIKSLEIIPGGTDNSPDLWDKNCEKAYYKMKTVLQEQYGWPDNFQEVEWKATSKMIRKHINDEWLK